MLKSLDASYTRKKCSLSLQMWQLLWKLRSRPQAQGLARPLEFSGLLSKCKLISGPHPRTLQSILEAVDWRCTKAWQRTRQRTKTVARERASWQLQQQLRCCAQTARTNQTWALIWTAVNRARDGLPKVADSHVFSAAAVRAPRGKRLISRLSIMHFQLLPCGLVYPCTSTFVHSTWTELTWKSQPSYTTRSLVTARQLNSTENYGRRCLTPLSPHRNYILS